ncbi:YraN family protein [Plantactinospora sp. WMMB334]|uniref:YraN family protein n=1 Tax=Plantactinospora sp. WMMB334 TaxID=3404119 RepID=UPI003B930415
MTAARQAVGAYGERCAVRHLIEAGLRVVVRNWRCRHGEIDIIAWEGEVLAFCEVKTRRSGTFGAPADAVERRKVQRLRRLALEWLRTSGVHPEQIRFDVIEVYPARSGPARIEHLRAAF